MKNLFSKENFLPSTFEKKAKIQSLVLSILILVFFIFSGFTFFNMLYAFSDELGSIVCGSMDVAIKDLLRSLPLFFSFFMSLWTLLLLHSIYRNVDEEKRNKSIFRKSIVILSLAGVSIIYVIICLIVGKYSSITEGSPSALYPLDSVLYSIFYLLIGLCGLLYSLKFKERFPLVVPSHGTINKKCRMVYCIFFAIFLLVALFGFSSGVLSIFIYDFKHGHAFYGIALVLIYLLSPFILAFWEFFFNELKEEKKNDVFLPVSIISLAVSVVFVTLYIVALTTDLDAPSNAGFGMLPVAFAASINIATLVMVFSPFIFSVVAFIKAILARKKAK